MTMDLSEALERVEEIRTRHANHRGNASRDLPCCAVADRDAEALGLVLARARENLAAETVAKVNALSARALAITRPHPFRRSCLAGDLGCYDCGGREFDPLHQEPGGTP